MSRTSFVGDGSEFAKKAVGEAGGRSEDAELMG